jgi:hypothetical protein
LCNANTIKTLTGKLVKGGIQANEELPEELQLLMNLKQGASYINCCSEVRS